MSIYDFKVKTRAGEEVSLQTFKGKVLLIVNTATGCGFTPQYKSLEELYETYYNKGFEVLDFPCDQFAKIEVNGKNEEPLYTYLKEQQPNEEVKGLKDKVAMKAIQKMSTTCKNKGDIVWNFTKFLIDKNGNVVKRYNPMIEPDKIENDIKSLL